VRHIGLSNFTPQHIQELIDETEYGIQGAFVQMGNTPLVLERRFGNPDALCGAASYHGGVCPTRRAEAIGRRCPQILDEIAERLAISRVQVVWMGDDQKMGGFGEIWGPWSHLRQNLQTPSLVGVLSPQDCAAIDIISSPGAEEKLCWIPGQSPKLYETHKATNYCVHKTAPRHLLEAVVPHTMCIFPPRKPENLFRVLLTDASHYLRLSFPYRPHQ